MAAQKKRPAITPEARENELISLAFDAAEKQLKSGKATSQLITHFLKLGTVKYEYEIERLRADTELSRAKTEDAKAKRDSNDLYTQAIEAFRGYAGLKQEER